jgi:hypothetical protein
MASDWTNSYQKADFEVLYRRDNWRSWEEVIHWLRTKGMKDRDITPGEANHIAADIQLLKDDDVRFTDDAGRAYHLAKSHCNHSAQSTAPA